MRDVAEMLDADLAAGPEKELGDEVTIDAHNYPATVHNLGISADSGTAGFEEGAEISAVIRTRLFLNANYPRPQSTLVWNGITYRIIRPQLLSGGGAIRLECREFNAAS